MYAIVASGLQTLCKTKRQLDTIVALYPYPKFQYVRTEEEGRQWLRQHTRLLNDFSFNRYGTTSCVGYMNVEYAIHEDKVEYFIDTRKLGYVKIQGDESTAVDSRPDSIHVVVQGLQLDNELIMHHVIAIRRLLRLVGVYVDVNVVVPDVSVYLAMSKYTGGNYVIRAIQRDIKDRVGGVSVTVKNTGLDEDGGDL